jgi:hypothetical protein
MTSTDGIFPITRSEAAVLHDMGWSSGFGWATEWDWWKPIPTNAHGMANRDSSATKQDLYADLIAIRKARQAADDLVREHMPKLTTAPDPKDGEVTG